MHQELLNLNLTHSVLNLDVPVVMFLGRYDRHTDSRLSAAYLDSLRAPQKKLVWFEQSAHNVPFEQPQLFNSTVVRELESFRHDSQQKAQNSRRDCSAAIDLWCGALCRMVSASIQTDSDPQESELCEVDPWHDTCRSRDRN